MVSEFYTTITDKRIERRTFLKLGSISLSGLVLGMNAVKSWRADKADIFNPNVFIIIEKSGEVTLIVHRSEMGQGTKTSMAGIIADELEADWAKVKVVQAEGDRKYGDQNTDGSKSIRDFYLPMRRMGATARRMLEQAAANQWGVSVNNCKAKNNEVLHTGSNRKLGFGRLVEAASQLEVPTGNAINLKSSSEFKFIGKKTPSVDIQDIVQGKAAYGIDQKIEGMKYAVIARCPVYGGRFKSYDDAEALKVPGVERTVEIKSAALPFGHFRPLGGIAVIASSTWAAIEGRKKLNIEWDEGANSNYNSSSYQENILAGFDEKTSVRASVGDVDAQEINLQADYLIPHYAHTPMEPPCALANVDGDKCEVWSPSQSPQWAHGVVAGLLGLSPANVKLNVTLLGGGFGRKAKPDYVVEAAYLSKQCACPVKLTWTREDDVRHGFYHAQSAQQMKATISADNKVIAWNHRSAFPSISGTANLSAMEMTGAEAGQGFEDMPYDIPNIKLEVGEAAPTGIRIGWLRSVANINHAFAIGSFLDEIATARKMDAKENLLDLLGEDRIVDFSKRSPNLWYYGKTQEEYPWDTSRFRGVINLVAEKSGWGKRMSTGSGMGIAAHRSFLTYVACVVMVEVQSNGRVSIPEVHYAVDCGTAVNPDRIRAQFEGGAAFGTSLALYSNITVEHGKVSQSNFNDYKIARMDEAPREVHVHIVESDKAPTGVGEPPVPPFSPALCNAIFAATGKRMRKLPVDRV